MLLLLMEALLSVVGEGLTCAGNEGFLSVEQAQMGDSSFTFDPTSLEG